MTDSPRGLVYRPDFLAEDEERAVIDAVEALEFHAVTMRGQTARRTVRHFGLDYDYETYKLTETEPFPDELRWLQERCAALIDAEANDLAQTLVSRYPAGATIGWHRDAPMFGTIVGVSLGSACRMRFQRGNGAEREVYAIELEPRSAYVLADEVRTHWQHSIPPTKDLRYSITFRTLRNPDRYRS